MPRSCVAPSFEQRSATKTLLDRAKLAGTVHAVVGHRFIVQHVVAGAVGIVCGVAPAFVLGGCDRPPVVGSTDNERATNDALDLATFLQDRPAIGGKWYDYNVDGHVLVPKPHAWLVRLADGGVAGFRIVSVYDADTGESGRFTLERTTWSTNEWSTPSLFVVQGNVKDGTPLCVDLVTPSPRECAGAGWQVRFVLQHRLSLAAGFAVAEPAVFLADDVVAARVELDATNELTTLPNPRTIADLVEMPPAPGASTDWDFSRFARDLPPNGRALGAVSLLENHTVQVLTTSSTLVDLVVSRTAQELSFVVQSRTIAAENQALGAPIESTTTLSLTTPRPWFLHFDLPELLVPAESLGETSWPLRPPFAKNYDLVVVDGDDDPQATNELVLLLSPAAAASRVPEGE
jgi:hypothetical protein